MGLTKAKQLPCLPKQVTNPQQILVRLAAPYNLYPNVKTGKDLPQPVSRDLSK
jgi:hypothetical protein